MLEQKSSKLNIAAGVLFSILFVGGIIGNCEIFYLWSDGIDYSKLFIQVLELLGTLSFVILALGMFLKKISIIVVGFMLNMFVKPDMLFYCLSTVFSYQSSKEYLTLFCVLIETFVPLCVAIFTIFRRKEKIAKCWFRPGMLLAFAGVVNLFSLYKTYQVQMLIAPFPNFTQIYTVVYYILISVAYFLAMRWIMYPYPCKSENIRKL